jgi:hypothetical protein
MGGCRKLRRAKPSSLKLVVKPPLPKRITGEGLGIYSGGGRTVVSYTERI